MPFEVGNRINPNGRPSGFQGFADRTKHLLGTHDVNGIMEYVTDPAKFGKLSAYDAMIMRRIAEAFSADGNASMNSLLDRIIGKPVQPIAQKIEHSVDSETISAMRELQALPQDALLAISRIVDESLPGGITIENGVTSE